jgi:hypothetical protein
MTTGQIFTRLGLDTVFMDAPLTPHRRAGARVEQVERTGPSFLAIAR